MKKIYIVWCKLEGTLSDPAIIAVFSNKKKAENCKWHWQSEHWNFTYFISEEILDRFSECYK